MRNIVSLSLLVLILATCRLKDDLDRLAPVEWKPDMAIPLIDTRVEIGNVLDRFDHDSLFSDVNGFVTLVYTGNIFSANGDVIFPIPEPTFPAPAQISIPNLTFDISLGELANAIGDPARTTIINNHGTNAVFPLIPAQPGGTSPLSGNNSNINYTFEQGMLVMTINNGYPADITNLNISLYDSLNNITVASYVFPQIQAGSRQSRSADLTGKTITNNMHAVITSISSPGTFGPVPIDTSDLLLITFAGADMIFEVLRDTIAITFSKGERLETLRFKQGEFNYSGTSTLAAGVEGRILFPNSTPLFDQTFPIGGTATKDLSGLELDMTSGGTGFNEIIAVLKVDGTDDTILFAAGQTITPSMNFTNFLMDYADGYLGQQVFGVPGDTIQISIYQNYEAGSVTFEDPKLNIIVTNEFGFPIQAVFNTFEAFSSPLQQTVAVLSSAINTIDFNFPTLEGDSAITTVLLDKNNSNVKDVLELPPSEVRYNLGFASNAAGDTSIFNFINSNSNFRVDVDVILPMHGLIGGLVIQDTFDLKQSLIANVDYANFAVVTSNHFPMDIQIQMYFVDGNYNRLDSLMPAGTKVFAAGTINADGKVISATTVTAQYPFGETRFGGIKTATQMLVRALMITNNKGTIPVKLYVTDYMEMKVGINARIKPF